MIPGISPILNIVLLSLVASLGTGLGGLIAIIRRPGKRSYGLLMGITAGVMLGLAFLQLVVQSFKLAGYGVATIGFASGATVMFLLDYFSPHIRFGEKEVRSTRPPSTTEIIAPQRQVGRWRRRFSRHEADYDHRLVRTGLLLAIGITLHNLPEGIAVGAGYLHSPAFGLFIATAIMLHNIPEGIATALPLCKGGMNRQNALLVAVLSGLAEPIGALFAALVLANFQQLIPAALAFAGGVMVFITLDELIPTAREHGHEHYVAIGIILGSIFVFILSGLLGV